MEAERQQQEAALQIAQEALKYSKPETSHIQFNPYQFDDGEFDQGDPSQARQTVRIYECELDGLLHVEVKAPGDDTTVYDEVLNDGHIRRWPKFYENFISGKDMYEGQTRIEEVGWLSENTRYMLLGKGVPTLELLAAVTDTNIEALGMGSRRLRDRARQELEKKAKTEVALTEVEALQKQNEELQARLAKLEAAASKK